jgi:phage terminase Nu1 subunit (DNA packaging protein)
MKLFGSVSGNRMEPSKNSEAWHGTRAQRRTIPTPNFEGLEISGQQLAGLLGLSEIALVTLNRDGNVKKVGPNRFDFAESIRLYCAHIRAVAARHQNAPGYGAIQKARARKEEAQAAINELKLRELQGELIPVAEVRHTWLRVVNVVRAALLNVHTVVGMRLGLDKPQVQVVRECIRRTLMDLADNAASRLQRSQDASPGPKADIS